VNHGAPVRVKIPASAIVAQIENLNKSKIWSCEAAKYRHFLQLEISGDIVGKDGTAKENSARQSKVFYRRKHLLHDFIETIPIFTFGGKLCKAKRALAWHIMIVGVIY